MVIKRIYPVRDVVCPVCLALIGHRRFDEARTLFCEECQYYWKYAVKRKLPVGVKYREPVEKAGCGCGRCGR